MMVAIFVPAVLIHSSAFAQSTDAANGLQISPALVQLNGEKGKSYTVELKVLNVTGSDLSFKTAVNDFRNTWGGANLGVLFALVIGFVGTLIGGRGSVRRQEALPIQQSATEPVANVVR